MNIKIAAYSDIHGILPEPVDCDLAIIGGDGQVIRQWTWIHIPAPPSDHGTYPRRQGGNTAMGWTKFNLTWTENCPRFVVEQENKGPYP